MALLNQSFAIKETLCPTTRLTERGSELGEPPFSAYLDACIHMAVSMVFWDTSIF
jgi:hypothetical protein